MNKDTAMTLFYLSGFCLFVFGSVLTPAKAYQDDANLGLRVLSKAIVFHALLSNPGNYVESRINQARNIVDGW